MRQKTIPSQRSALRSPAVLPDDVREEVARARELHLEATRLARESEETWRDVARKVADAGLSLHDISRLLGVSPARVRELLGEG